MPRHYFIPIIPFVFWRMSMCVQTFKEKQRECEYSLTDTVVLSAIASRARLLVLMLRRQWRSSRADWIRTQAWGRLVSLVSVFIQTTPPAETLNTVFRGTWRSNTHQYSIFIDLLNFVFITKALWFVFRFVILLRNGSRPQRSSTQANLRMPGPSNSLIRTGREEIRASVSTHLSEWLTSGLRPVGYILHSRWEERQRESVSCWFTKQMRK